MIRSKSIAGFRVTLDDRINIGIITIVKIIFDIVLLSRKECSANEARKIYKSLKTKNDIRLFVNSTGNFSSNNFWNLGYKPNNNTNRRKKK